MSHQVSQSSVPLARSSTSSSCSTDGSFGFELVATGPLASLRFAGTDQEIAHEIYAVDAVLEFAQSDGRFVGVENSKPLREKYPEPFGAPHCVHPRRGDLWVVENLINYDGRPWQPTVNILEFRGEKVVRDPSTSLRRGRRLTGAHRGEPRTEPTVGAGCAYAVARSRRIRTSRCSSSPNMKTCWSNSSYPRWR